MTPYQIVIIDDDLEMETRPLYEELIEKYTKTNVIWHKSPEDGLFYIKNNLHKKTIVVLDYDFGIGENGLTIFRKIQRESSLLYIIINTAKSINDIPNEELKIFINNHLMALVDKTDGYQKTLDEIQKGMDSLNNRVDCVLEEWIFRHKFFTKEEPFIKDENGNNITLNDVLVQIRQNTVFGQKILRSIISIAITSLQKDFKD